MTSSRQSNLILPRLPVVYFTFSEVLLRNITEFRVGLCPKLGLPSIISTMNSDRFTIQPYQFEPHVNSDEAESPSGKESVESDKEGANPQLENSDWYVALF